MPAPIAAPGPAWLEAAPMIAPVAAPSAVPPSAFAAAAFVGTCSAPGPSQYCAYSRQETSSDRNWSKFFDVPGIAMTAGPLGIATQPANASAAASGRNVERRRI